MSQDDEPVLPSAQDVVKTIVPEEKMVVEFRKCYAQLACSLRASLDERQILSRCHSNIVLPLHLSRVNMIDKPHISVF